MPRWRPFFATLALLALIAPPAARGQDADFMGREFDSGQPVVLIADRIERDDERGVTTATGNVELAQGGRVIVADSITYNERDNTVFASGNVTMREPSGDVLFAEDLKGEGHSNRELHGPRMSLIIQVSEDFDIRRFTKAR